MKISMLCPLFHVKHSLILFVFTADEQKEYAEQVMAEYYMESMADEFPSDTNNAKRGISKPNVIFFLIDDLGEKT